MLSFFFKKSLKFLQRLPWSSGRLDNWRQSIRKQGPGFAHVHYIEYNSLIFLCIFNGEMKPKSTIELK